ncbi:MAG: hypothetical protein V1720_20535 [bacterium]
MVQSIGSSNQGMAAQFNPDYKLTDEQKKSLEDILAKYDSENMTGESTKALFDELKSSGIPPSKDVKEALDAAGFKPPEKPQGPPPQMGTEELSQNAKTLLDYLQKVESGEATQEELNSFIAQLQNSGSILQGSIIDTSA